MFYFFNLFFLLIYAVMYAIFRQGLRSAHKISAKAKFKGAKNFWWFESVKDIKNLGKSYWVNKIFTILYLITAMVATFLGLLTYTKMLIFVLMSLVGTMLIPMNFYAFIHNNKKEFGCTFVGLRRRKDGTGKFHSSVVDMLWSCLPVFMMLFELVYLLR